MRPRTQAGGTAKKATAAGAVTPTAKRKNIIANCFPDSLFRLLVERQADVTREIATTFGSRLVVSHAMINGKQYFTFTLYDGIIEKRPEMLVVAVEDCPALDPDYLEKVIKAIDGIDCVRFI